VPPATLHAVEPETPEMAAQQGIGGAVNVIVSLDADSRVVGARIQSSPSALLNAAAIAAARASTFRTIVRDCKPVAGDFIFTVVFEEGFRFTLDANGARVLSATFRGLVPRPSDMGWALFNVVSTGDTAADRNAADAAAWAALVARLRAAGVADADVTTDAREATVRAPYEGAPTPARWRSVTVKAGSLDALRSVIAAAANLPSVGLRGVRLGLRDPRAAFEAAVADAVSDADERAADGARRAGVKIAAHRPFAVAPRDDAAYVTYAPLTYAPGKIPATVPAIVPQQVPVSATVTAVYPVIP
jgi:TonB family protein